MAVILPSADSALTFARRAERSRITLARCLQDLDKIAAGSTLNAHRNSKQLQVFRADALNHVEHRIVEVGPVGSSSLNMPNSVPTGSGNSRATREIAVGKGCPAIRLRLITSRLPGNWPVNFLMRAARTRIIINRGPATRAEDDDNEYEKCRNAEIAQRQPDADQAR